MLLDNEVFDREQARKILQIIQNSTTGLGSIIDASIEYHKLQNGSSNENIVTNKLNQSLVETDINRDKSDKAQLLFESNYPQSIITEWFENTPVDFIDKLTTEIIEWLDTAKDHAQLTSEEENLQEIEISGISNSKGTAATIQQVMEYISADITVVKKLLSILSEYSKDKKL